LFAADPVLFQDLPTKEPVVLAHGLLGFDSVSVATIGISYWRGIKEALEAIGCEVLIAKVGILTLCTYLN
jgi:triacylglycerol lipase